MQDACYEINFAESSNNMCSAYISGSRLDFKNRFTKECIPGSLRQLMHDAWDPTFSFLREENSISRVCKVDSEVKHIQKDSQMLD